MASGSDDQPINSPTKINLLDGDMRYQIMRYKGCVLKEMYRLNITTSIDEKDFVHNAHLDFLNSGSTQIRTNTYHALYPYLKVKLGLDMNGYTKLVENSVAIAVESAAVYCLTNNIHESSLNIVGSCGCFKDEILDSLPSDNLEAAHRQRISILVRSGVNMLSLEGIRDIKEAEMLLNIVREFEHTKIFVMFDDNEPLRSIVSWVKRVYSMYSPQITAIGLNNVNNKTAIKFCKKIIEGRKTENLIPLVMCVNKKSDGNAWNPIDVNSNVPVIEWKKFGIHYIGGGKGVVANDIESVREKLNGS